MAAEPSPINYDLGNERRGAVEQAYTHISSLIELHRVQPGDRLPPAAELAADIGVSRPAVLQALKLLSSQGQLVVRPGRGGTWVSDAGPERSRARRAQAFEHGERIVQMAYLREMVEVGIARLLADKGMPGAALKEARRLVAAMAELTPGDDAEYHARNTDLHLLLARATGMPVLESTVAMCRREVAAAHDLGELPEGRRRESDSQHEALLDAIEQRDPLEAERVARAHITSSTQRLETLLGRSRRSGVHKLPRTPRAKEPDQR